MSRYRCGTTGHAVELRTADVLVYRGRLLSGSFPFVHPIGAGIAAFTGGWWVHAGTVLCGRLEHSGEMRHLVTDATASGIDVRPVSADLRLGRRIGVLRVPASVTVDGGGLAGFVWPRWGISPYAKGKLLAHGWVEVWGGSDAPDPRAIPNSWICSEWSSLLLRRFARVDGHGLDPCPFYADRYTSPMDLARRSLLRWVTQRLELAEEPA